MTFRTKTILGIATIEIVLLMALVFSAMSFLSDSNEKQLIQRAQATSLIFARATKDAVLSTDIATLDDIVKDIMTIEDVLYVKVEQHGVPISCDGDKALLERHIQSDSSLKNIDDGVFDIVQPIESKGVTYGAISIGFATSAIDMMLYEAQNTIMSIAFIEVVFVAIFSFLLGTYLTRNLKKLSDAAKQVKQQGPGYQLEVSQKDELGEVASAFNKMSQSLHSNYEEIKLARSEAEQASESKSRFLASMSHEIRTPMNGILGILTLLQETKLSQQQNHLVNTATDSGELLLSIINDILDFSRMEANTLILEQKPFSITDCINGTIESFGPSVANKNLKLVATYQNSIPAVVIGDVHRFKQILLNLIGNAIKFTSEGSIEVAISTQQIDDKKISLHCKVSDTGIGIENTAMSYLFDEFTMVDQGYSRSRDGSGLGLAICKRLAELMDGEISVASEQGNGSTFSFNVTLEVDTQTETNKVIEAKPSSNLSNKILSSKILVAEDNTANQLVIMNMFKNVGMEIDIAQNGQQAVDMSRNNDYNLIFMDISMPEKDGIVASQEIRQFDDTDKASIPIIALTAHALTGDKEKFINAGMTDYLSKPMRMSQIVSMLSKYIDNEEHKDVPDMSQTQETQHSVSSVDLESLSQLVDEQILQQMIEDTCVEIIPVLIDHYVDETKKRMDKIQTAFKDHDADALEFESHTLGSSALALGNRSLSTLARKIEKLCQSGESEQAFLLVEELQPLADTSLRAILDRKEIGFESPA
ncbi:response regulator [Vibrio sp. T187]|uniref:ATP-binding protein n=1 Tax=Vibrio TaxID=662 RepID=UPI0010CA18B1|nr:MULTISPECIES: ATP-binding protein [Vibrio]MBW3697809.1 response regulator [Vibrio sp. T187]